jgi:hypothetical protein
MTRNITGGRSDAGSELPQRDEGMTVTRVNCESIVMTDSKATMIDKLSKIPLQNDKAAGGEAGSITASMQVRSAETRNMFKQLERDHSSNAPSREATNTAVTPRGGSNTSKAPEPPEGAARRAQAATATTPEAEPMAVILASARFVAHSLQSLTLHTRFLSCHTPLSSSLPPLSDSLSSLVQHLSKTIHTDLPFISQYSSLS